MVKEVIIKILKVNRTVLIYNLRLYFLWMDENEKFTKSFDVQRAGFMCWRHGGGKDNKHIYWQPVSARPNEFVCFSYFSGDNFGKQLKKLDFSR